MSAPESSAVDAGQDSIQDGWPLLRHQRPWNGFTIFATSVSTAIATWCFIIGGFVSYYLTAGQGTLAILAGSLIGILFIVLACLPACVKYGIDSVVGSRPQLGTRGSALSMVAIYASTLGWNVILFVFLGRATASIMGALGWTVPSWFVGACGVVGIVVVLLMLARGPDALRDFSRPIAVLVLILGFVILWMLIDKVGLNTLLDAPAVAPSEDPAVNWASGIEVLIASNLSWWAYTGAMVRNGPSARRSLWPVVIGLGLGVGVGSLTGFYAGLVLPDSGGDPTQFLVDIGGPAVGVLALAFIVLANIGTAVVGVYASTLAVRQIPGVNRWSWRASTLTAVLPAFVLVGFFADQVFAGFGTFLAFLGVCFGPLCGIQIVDYFLLRRQRYDLPGLYDQRPSGIYRYWGGFNPVGFLAFAAGVATYIYLLDPVTYVSRPPFQYMTASIPAIVVAGAVYWLGATLVLRPLKRGGYDRIGAAGAGTDAPAAASTADARLPAHGGPA
jgi:NCS1 family nucleobase:cation symporter-1